MTVRQELHAYIDDIPESKLQALKPLLFALADEAVVLEYDLTEDERAVITKGMEEYEENSDSFVPLDCLEV